MWELYKMVSSRCQRPLMLKDIAKLLESIYIHLDTVSTLCEHLVQMHRLWVLLKWNRLTNFETPTHTCLPEAACFANTRRLCTILKLDCIHRTWMGLAPNWISIVDRCFCCFSHRPLWSDSTCLQRWYKSLSFSLRWFRVRDLHTISLMIVFLFQCSANVAYYNKANCGLITFSSSRHRDRFKERRFSTN